MVWLALAKNAFWTAVNALVPGFAESGFAAVPTARPVNIRPVAERHAIRIDPFPGGVIAVVK